MSDRASDLSTKGPAPSKGKWVGIDEAERWPEGTPWVAIEFLDGDPECSYLHFEHDLNELRGMGSNWSHLFMRLDQMEISQ